MDEASGGTDVYGCTLEYAPVTDGQGVTWANLCQCENASAVPSSCDPDPGTEPCTLELIPHTDAEGVEWANRCNCEAFGVLPCTEGGGGDPGTCESCNCPTDAEVVCGDDGQTYNNACIAECNGVWETTSGACSTEEPQPGACALITEPLPNDPAWIGDYSGRPWFDEAAGLGGPTPCEAVDSVHDYVCGCDGYVYSRCAVEYHREQGDAHAPSYWSETFVLREQFAPNMHRHFTWDNETETGGYSAARCEIVEEGEPGVCDLTTEPVCGTDLETYQNEWMLDEAGVDKLHDGACEPCEGEPIDPVCGTGGTYPNACLALVHDEVVLAPGACLADTDCSQPEYGSEPVCGLDKITYANWCHAAQANVDWTEGECRSCENVPMGYGYKTPWGLCHAYCDVQDCYETPDRRSCLSIERNYRKVGGETDINGDMPCVLPAVD